MMFRPHLPSTHYPFYLISNPSWKKILFLFFLSAPSAALHSRLYFFSSPLLPLYLFQPLTVPPPPAPPPHKHTCYVSTTHFLSACLQCNSTTQWPNLERTPLHNYSWWGFHFEHLLISHFFLLPQLIKPVIVYWCQPCLLMIYMCAHHNRLD